MHYKKITTAIFVIISLSNFSTMALTNSNNISCNIPCPNNNTCPTNSQPVIAYTPPLKHYPFLPSCVGRDDLNNIVREKSVRENKNNSFAIAFYQPTYVMPYYYTVSPDYSAYQGKTPDNEVIRHQEIKYQLSFKVPIWKNIYNYPSTLFLAYTQMSYWQAYSYTAFFRSTDYQPEIFLANELNLRLPASWRLNFINVGAMHQSNGEGADLERSWNRVYVKAIASRGNFMVSVMPWWIVHDQAYNRYNPGMASFLGYGEVVTAYKFRQQVVSLSARNFLHYDGKRSSATLSYSFPITPYLNGYIQAFSGYGQSLIEYNHRTNSIGIGISLSNYI